MSDNQLMTLSTLEDILSHHYFDLDAETIFVICDSYLEELLSATNKMIVDVKSADF